jgi:hypothetical protein
LKHLYVMSLEVPGPGCAIYVGRADIERLSSYVSGFIDGETGLQDRPGIARDDEDFWDWLYVRGEFPTQGWARYCLEECENDNEQALARFFGLLHAFLLERRPAWFVEFNAKPQPSPLLNGHGQPRSLDIRFPQHIELVGPARDA